jgi:hypothetical protein
VSEGLSVDLYLSWKVIPRMSKSRRILIWVGASLVVAFAYLWLFGVQTAFALWARHNGIKIPELSDTPRELQNTSLNQSRGAEFSRFGYEFELPWSDFDQAKIKIVGQGCLISFESGIRIRFTTEPARAFVNDVASKSGGEESLRRNFGDEAISSDYNFYRLMLTTTPASVSPLGSREAASSNSTLLILKAIAMPEPGHSGIYSLHTANFRGFQYGAPGNSRHMVVSDLLDDKGNAEFIFFDVPGQPHITQADINRATQSLKRVSDVATESSQNPSVTLDP